MDEITNNTQHPIGMLDGHEADDSMTRSGTSRKSGRVAFEADGRGVWEWQVTTGVFTRTVTEDQLMELAAANLQLADPPPIRHEARVWLYETDQALAARRAGPRYSSRSEAGREQSGSMRRWLKKLTG